MCKKGLGTHVLKASLELYEHLNIVYKCTCSVCLPHPNTTNLKEIILSLSSISHEEGWTFKRHACTSTNVHGQPLRQANFIAELTNTSLTSWFQVEKEQLVPGSNLPQVFSSMEIFSDGEEWPDNSSTTLKDLFLHESLRRSGQLEKVEAESWRQLT